MKVVTKNEEVVVKGCKINVDLTYYYDEDNDMLFDDIELGNENLRKIRNAYRKEKCLLFDHQIKKIREKYNLNQRNFSLLLGFGEITITRYESKSIQEKAHDAIIRNADNPKLFLQMVETNKEAYLKYNSLESYNNLITIINSRISNDLSNSGNIEYSVDKFTAVINYILSKLAKLTKTKLAKLLWYIDNLSYKEYNHSITGLTYIHNYYGAYPIGYNDKLSIDNIKINVIYYDDNDNPTCFIESCITDGILNEEEKQVIDKVIKELNKYNTKELVEYMHKEDAYIKTKQNEIISFDYSKKLSISL